MSVMQRRRRISLAGRTGVAETPSPELPGELKVVRLGSGGRDCVVFANLGRRQREVGRVAWLGWVLRIVPEEFSARTRL
jgi:hypothetical protein